MFRPPPETSSVMKLKIMQRIGEYRRRSGFFNPGPKADTPYKSEAIFFLWALLVSAALSFLLSGYIRIRIPKYFERGHRTGGCVGAIGYFDHG